MEIYRTLFQDVLSANLFFALDYEYVIWIMHMFDQHNRFSVLFVSIAAFILASTINYIIGYILYKLYMMFCSEKNKVRYNNLKQLLAPYNSIILLSLLVPGFKKFTFLFLGFLQISLIKMIFIGTIIQSLYYSWFIF